MYVYRTVRGVYEVCTRFERIDIFCFCSLKLMLEHATPKPRTKSGQPNPLHCHTSPSTSGVHDSTSKTKRRGVRPGKCAWVSDCIHPHALVSPL